MRAQPLNRFRSQAPALAAAAALAASPISLNEIGERTLTREYTIDKSKIDEGNRTIELSFSSEAEVERWFDEIEVLDHSPGACDLSRLNDGGNLLFNHHPSDVLGVVEQARIDSDRKGRAIVRFSDSTRGEEKWKEVKGGILRKVSVGYRIRELVMQEKRESGKTVYRITKWEPFEVSIVTIPADTTVGVGRQQTNNPTHKPSQFRSIMNRQQTIDALLARSITFDENASDEALAGILHRNLTESNQPPASRVQVVRETQSRTAEQELARVREINAAGAQFKLRDLSDRAVADGMSLEEFRGLALEEINKRTSAMRESHNGIGMSDKEAKRFSFVRLLSSLAAPNNAGLRNAAGFEWDAVEAAASKSGDRKIRGVLIPADVLTRGIDLGNAKRDIISIGGGAGYAATAGNLVQTNLLVGSFIDMLRNKTTVMGRATVLTGLEGDIDIPKQLGKASAGWIGEDDDAPATDVKFGIASMTPHTVAAYSQLTRRTLKQTSLDVEAFVRADMAAAAAEAIDLAAFYGDGTGNQPVGILFSNPTAINFAGVYPTWSEIVAMETALGTANIDASRSVYVGNATFKGHAKTTKKFSTSGSDATLWETGGTVNGYACDVTNQVGNGDLFFGDFSQLVIGLWGGLDVLVDPFSDSQKGRLNITAMQDVDFVVRRNKAFAFGRKPAGS